MALRRTYPAEFEKLWKQYPNKSAKQTAYKAWQRKISAEDRDELVMHVVERRRLDANWSRGFVPHLATFINGERWEDDYPRVPVHAGKHQEAKAAEPWKKDGFDTEDEWHQWKWRQQMEAYGVQIPTRPH